MPMRLNIGASGHMIGDLDSSLMRGRPVRTRYGDSNRCVEAYAVVQARVRSLWSVNLDSPGTEACL